MSQRIKPDRPIWPSLPETEARTMPAPRPAETPRAAMLHGGGPSAAGAQARRIAPATVEAFGSFAG